MLAEHCMNVLSEGMLLAEALSILGKIDPSAMM